MDSEEILTEEVTEEQAAEPEFNLATIGDIFDDGISLIFDGEEQASEKHYKCNGSVKFLSGDRVKVFKDSGTYLIEYVVGTRCSRYPIPAGGSYGDMLVKNSDLNYSCQWVTAPHGVPSGGTEGQVLTKRSDKSFELQWTTPRGVPAGGSSGQVLAKSSDNNYALQWVNLPHGIPSGGTDGQVLMKNGSGNFAVKWANISQPHGIPSGGSSGQALVKNSGNNYDVKWGSISAKTDRVQNSSYSITLSSNTFQPSRGDTINLGSNSYPFENLYANGYVYLGNAYSGSQILLGGSSARVGFFGKTPTTKQSVYSSATLSQVINALKAYGLF